MIKRIIEDKIFNRLAANKVMLFFGPRRVGKTVLMRQLIDRFEGKHLLLNGEDAVSLALLESKSISNYKRLLDGIDLLSIDEAQNIAEIGQKLKLIVDEVPGIKVMASGSFSFDLQNKAGEPLVGRSTQFQLFPFSQAELSQKENILEIKQNLEDRLIYGSYPEVVNITDYVQKKDYLRDIVNA
ncbi:MAG: AAA family ATPase [Paludibacter sp.]|nr:AAA family ATPase [Paludibacter sp.]